MQKNSDHYSQVNIWEVVTYLRINWRWYVVGSLIGALVGFLLFWVVPPKYEASVVIQPARVGSITGGFANPVVQGNELESAAFMVERFKQPGFFSESMRQRCQVAYTSGYQKEMANDLSASIVKLQNQPMSLAKLSWKAATPEIAQDCILAIVEAITEVQNSIAGPVVSSLIRQREISQREVNLYLAELAKIDRQESRREPAQTAFNQIVIADKAAQNLRESLALARKQLAEEDAQLTAPYTQKVLTLAPVYASQDPTIAFKSAVGLSALLGMLFGICALLVRRSVLVSKSGDTH